MIHSNAYVWITLCVGFGCCLVHFETEASGSDTFDWSDKDRKDSASKLCILSNTDKSLRETE